MAVDITSVKRAICMLYSEVAEAVEPKTYQTYDFDSWADLPLETGEPTIRGVRIEMKLPEIIRVPEYRGFPPREVSFCRRNLVRRDRARCQYCGKRVHGDEMTIDHVIPRSRGGKSSWSNCVLACVKCNGKKAARTPREARMRLLSRPIKPDWAPRLSVPLGVWRHSWQQFISDAYWNVELDE
jgi:5-methylcytosine-specific restriction endonuclease McrA